MEHNTGLQFYTNAQTDQTAMGYNPDVVTPTVSHAQVKPRHGYQTTAAANY